MLNTYPSNVFNEYITPPKKAAFSSLFFIFAHEKINNNSHPIAQMSNKIAKKSFSDLRVLLVDDIDSNRIVVINILRRFSMKIETASNGFEAIDQLKKNDFDIILMDLAMPEMDGVTATRIIRKEFDLPKRDIPIIALTASLVQESTDRVFEAGMNVCISKPVASKELLEIIGKFTGAVQEISPAVNSRTGSEYYPVDDMIDLTYLFEVARGDDQFAAELIENFISNTPPILKTIKQKLEQEDIEGCRKSCHKLKPVLSYMGLKQITPIFAKFHENLQRDQVNLRGELLILNKLEELISEAISRLQKIKLQLISNEK
ncbi:MAG: response regulator [Ignavibacteriaceae bacterium]|jgi:CheY-like chemotaxis protein/HPt (histidine-containing phosphotransfer) domain-containing protein|nr:response regulator [Ignavibacteriaceae bacterium]